MFATYSAYIQKRANGKALLIILVFYGVYAAGVMGWGAKKIQTLAGAKVQILDLSVTGYTPTEVTDYLNAYTQEAKTFAISFEKIADTIYPIMYSIMLTLLMAWVYKGNKHVQPVLKYVLWLPLLVVIFDYAENYHIIKMLQLHPEIPESLVYRSSFFTIGKWCLFGISLVFILLGLVTKWIK